MQCQSATSWLAPDRAAERFTRLISASPGKLSADFFETPSSRGYGPLADSRLALNVRRKLIAAQKYPFAPLAPNCSRNCFSLDTMFAASVAPALLQAMADMPLTDQTMA